MNTHIEFKDPWFQESSTDEYEGTKISYPVVNSENIRFAIEKIRQNSKSYFSSVSPGEIQSKLDILDDYFSRLDDPEIKDLAELIRKTSGFSMHDIEKYGLGLFSILANYNKEQRGEYVIKALKKSGRIETTHGYLKRYGLANPFTRWKEPELISHFISGNVVGYTAILSRIGFPVKTDGAAQIVKLPSSSAFFPLLYLEKLGEIDSDLRNTIACGYWKGGDNSVEKTLIEESDAINILSSDIAIQDLKVRIQKHNRSSTQLLHGHKIGFAYVAREFLDPAGSMLKVIDGLVRDISAFDGGACYTVKNIFVQGDTNKFSELLFERLNEFARTTSPVSQSSKPTANSLHQIYLGSSDVLSSPEKNAFVRIKQEAEFWLPNELFRYVQVMPVKDEREVQSLIARHKRYLQTAIIAVPDDRIIPVFELFGRIGVSNIHHPGSAAILQVYEEPHDSEFDFIKIRYKYSGRFAAINFKRNSDWLD